MPLTLFWYSWFSVFLINFQCTYFSFLLLDHCDISMSQSSLLEDVKNWDVATCRQNLQALPSLIVSLSSCAIISTWQPVHSYTLPSICMHKSTPCISRGSSYGLCPYSQLYLYIKMTHVYVYPLCPEFSKKVDLYMEIQGSKIKLPIEVNSTCGPNFYR